MTVCPGLYSQIYSFFPIVLMISASLSIEVSNYEWYCNFPKRCQGININDNNLKFKNESFEVRKEHDDSKITSIIFTYPHAPFCIVSFAVQLMTSHLGPKLLYCQ